jgi:vacuolar-type H+-ATPase subunit I/STV1
LAPFKKNQIKVMCQDCKGEFHGKCVKLTQTDVDFLNENGGLWRCQPCNTTRRKSIRLEYSQAEGGVTLEAIMGELKEIQENQRRTETEFNKSYEALHSNLEENTSTLRAGMEKIETYIKEIERLKGENAALKSKVSDLENRVDELENYSRRNCVEIQGIPEDKGEKTIEIVKKVGKALSVDINDSMVDACHRVGKAERDRPRGIIVKFVRRTDKEELMSRRRERKRDFSTRHLDMPTDKPIYINDSLSPARRRLLALARQIRRDKGYKYIWLRNGNILLRKDEGSPVVELRNQADLSKL